ncbi:MAG: lipocalin family protein [Ginsengibacter sp.]
MKTKAIKRLKNTIYFGAIAIAFLLVLPSCKKDSIDPSLPTMKLTPDNVMGKTAQLVDVTLSIYAPNGIKSLEISKTINLVSSGGVTTGTPVSTGNNTYTFVYTYTYQPDEVNKLVGINFRLTDNKGNAVEKDLTVNTEASGAQKIYTHPWKLTSKLWETRNPIEENLQNCEKDDAYTFRADSTMAINYGTTGCLFDGFNIFDKWTLSEDETVFTWVYHSVFDPTKITVETFQVKSLTKDKLVMELTIDLSAFGLSKNELFLYTFETI